MSHGTTRLAAALAALLATAALLVAQAPTAGAAVHGPARCRTADAARACGSWLTVTVQGGGLVTSSPGGISCREAPARPGRGAVNVCQDVYDPDDEVTLTAVPDDGYHLVYWDDACSGTVGPTCELTMTTSQDVTAVFSDTYVLRTEVIGAGTVTSDPGDIECRDEDDDDLRAARGRKDPCSADIEDGAPVTLTAEPDPGQQFAGWSTPRKRGHGRTPPAACAGTSPTCTLTMVGNVAVRATFEPATTSPYVLRVSTAGPGSGSVTAAPGGDCSSLCWYPLEPGTSVTLTAVPAAGSTFTGFTGASCPGNPCTVTMSETRYVTATFGLADAPDTTAPQTTITSGPRYSANDHSQFGFASSEEGSTFQCSLDGGPRQDCVTGVDYPCLAPGRHTFRVWATDPAGNTDPTAASRRFRVHADGSC